MKKKNMRYYHQKMQEFKDNFEDNIAMKLNHRGNINQNAFRLAKRRKDETLEIKDKSLLENSAEVLFNLISRGVSDNDSFYD